MSRAAPLHARGLTVSLGGRTILDHIDVTLARGRRIGLVGPNGVGKSTLLRALAGQVEPEQGLIERTPPTATVGFLHQELHAAPHGTSPSARAQAAGGAEPGGGETVRELLYRRTGVAAAAHEMEAATHGLASGADGADDRYSAALEQWMALGGADLDSRIDQALVDVGLPPGCLDQPVATLSGGQAGRAGLAALLLSRYDAYLLDEPTNDLDMSGLAVLERWITGLEAAVMVVSHDRRFLSKVVTDVVEIDEFTRTARHFSGGWDAYLHEREQERLRAWERFEQYDTQRRSLTDRAQRQREWADQGRSAVRRSGENDKNIRHRWMAQTEKLAGKAAQTTRALDRLDAVEKPREPWQLRLQVATTGRSGDLVAELRGAVVERGDFRLGPIDLQLGVGERVVLAGANGSGKSTLVDALLGRAELTAGSVRLGSSVVVGEIMQVRRQLDGGGSLLDAFVAATGQTISDARTLLAKFGLVGDHVQRPTSSLSPGERTRAALALLMANGANWLVLDEPTNHLDLPAIEQLEAALATFTGTVLLVTHDRALLERVEVTRTVEVDGGRVVGDAPTSTA